MSDKPLLTIEKLTHGIVVKNFDDRVRSICKKYAARNVLMGLEKVPGRPGLVMAPIKVFAAATDSRNEFRFHINQYKEFTDHLKVFGIEPSQIELIERPLAEGKSVDWSMYPHWKPLDYQHAAIDYIVPPTGYDASTGRSKVVVLQTGKGKGFIMSEAIRRYGKRMLMILKPKYIEKWIKELQVYFNIEPDNILVIRGGANLMAAIAQAQSAEFDAIDVIIVSNKTFQGYISEYEGLGKGLLEAGYDCLPDQFCERLGIGVRVTDEVHEDFHLNFKIDLYTHVPLTVVMSATLKPTRDPFMTRQKEIAFPTHTRFAGMAYHRYARATSIFYRFENVHLIKSVDYATNRYSHHLVESSIMKQPKVKRNYFEMIDFYLRDTYFRNKKPGDRAAIFAISVDMCTALVAYFKQLYPQLTIKRFCQGDPIENLTEPDIAISTVQSGGTGHDIKNLTTVILTIAIASENSNEQTFGRLRELKSDGRVPHFLYMSCTEIPKHMQYHEWKQEMLQAMALYNHQTDYPVRI